MNKNAGLLDPSRGSMPVKAKARLVTQGQHRLDNAQGLVKTNAPTVHRTAVSVFFPVVASIGWCRSLGGVEMSCAFPGTPLEIQEPLFSEPPAHGLPGSLIEIVKGVFGLPDSPRDWWKELRDTLQEDSWKSIMLDPAFFHLRGFSGNLIGTIFVYVDDMLFATNDSHQAGSHISRSSENTVSPSCKRADSNEGVLYSGKRIRTVPRPGGLALRQDQAEFVKPRCGPANMSRVRANQEGGLSVQQAESERCEV